MKNDRYIKIILTIIAICLVWICVRDIKIGPIKAYAMASSGSGTLDVNIESSNVYALADAGPIEVTVSNWPTPSPVPQEKDK